MKSRILVLTPRWPYPPIGGDRLRISEICKYLAARFELSLLSLCESVQEMDAPPPPDGVFARTVRVYHPPSRRLAGMARALPTDIPMQVGYYRNPEFARRLAELAPANQALFAHLVRTAPYLLPWRMPRIVEMTDAISLAYRRIAEHSRGPRRLAYMAESRRLARFERRIISACDLTVLVSAVDRDSLDLGSETSRVLIASNGVDAAALPYDCSPDGRTIVFIGKNLFAPNADAILYFVQEVLPAVQARVPRATFKVVGEIHPDFAERLRAQGVIVTGRVPSIRESTRHGSVAVCPLRFGAGVQNKLLEYMSLGIPAVTSPVGLEGLHALPGTHLFVAATPQQWADRVVELLEQPALACGIAHAARRFVEDRHSWAAHLEPLAQRIHRVLGNPPRPARETRA